VSDNVVVVVSNVVFGRVVNKVEELVDVVVVGVVCLEVTVGEISVVVGDEPIVKLN